MIGHIGRVCLDLRSVRRRFALRVTPIRLLLVLALGVVAPVATCLAAATVSAATADSAVSSDTVADGFNEDLASETPELAANQWGWRLTKYYELWNIYAIRGTLYLRLVADIHSDSGIIWSPLTGRGAHLDSQAFKKFAIDYEKNRISIPLDGVTLPRALPDGLSLESHYTPGGNWRCLPLFYEYYSVVDKNKKIIRSFYIIEKADAPFKETVNCAGEAGTIAVTDSLTYNYQSLKFSLYAELGDGTSIIVSYGSPKDGLIIIRLGSDLRQRTTMGGRIYLMDAEPFNTEVEDHQNNWDDNYRYELFLKYLDALKTKGAP